MQRRKPDENAKVPREETAEGFRKSKQSPQAYASNYKLKIYFLTALAFTAFIVGIHLNIFPWTRQSHESNFLDDISVSLGIKKCIYSVVIDAGSTGSRVVTYAFIESFGEKILKLYKEYFMEVNPGLSSFVNNPAESTRGLDALIKEAKHRIPEENWSSTAIVMKATAGLRLLPEEKANALLLNARNVLKSSGFYVTDNSVSVLDEIDEGLMSWFTVNFLLDRLGGSSMRTVAALDLGGGSTQISFVPAPGIKLTGPEEKYLHQVAAFHQNLNVYSRSYLGFGLMEGRKNMLRYGIKNQTTHLVKSECINPLVKTTWNYGSVDYKIQGPEDPQYMRSEERGEVFLTPIVGFKECEAIAKKVLSKIAKPQGLGDVEICAFSFYYDRAAESGLIDFKKGGVVTVKDFVSIARAKCREANVDQPFMCLDLIYISVFLRDGLGLSPTTKINLVKRIDGHIVSWALGAAFHVLQNGL